MQPESTQRPRWKALPGSGRSGPLIEQVDRLTEEEREAIFAAEFFPYPGCYAGGFLVVRVANGRVWRDLRAGAPYSLTIEEWQRRFGFSREVWVHLPDGTHLTVYR